MHPMSNNLEFFSIIDEIIETIYLVKCNSIYFPDEIFALVNEEEEK